jgi:hypothetical protein
MDQYPEWFLKKPFRPLPQTDGEQEEDVLHLAVGRIAHNWEHLEGALFYLYQRVSGFAHQGGNYAACAATYGAVISSSGRRDVLEAMVRVTYPPESGASELLLPILSRVQRGVGRRNDAVHGLVVRYNRVGLFVMPPNYVPIAPWTAHDETSFKYRYDVGCLAGINSVLQELRKEVLAACDVIRPVRQPTLREISPQQAGRSGPQTGPQGGQQ